MATSKAINSLAELEQALANDHVVKVAGIDCDGIPRGKIMSKSKFLSCVMADKSFGFCGVVFGWDINDATYTKELSVSNKANGYKDIIARIDLNTFRRMPFENNIPFFFCTFLDPDTNKELHVCPRGTLAKVLEQFEAKLNATAMCGIEYEYFQFKETPKTLHEKDFTDLTNLTEGMHGYSLTRTHAHGDWFHEIYDNCSKFDIAIEGHHTETGPGVYESALAFDKALRMADNAVLFKLTTKILGLKHGITPTFMAKPHNNLPGCSGHVHFSLRDSETQHNLFAVSKPRTDAKWPDLANVSETMEHFIAGILKGLPDIMPCLVPTVNGYKRLVENYWAPTSLSWGYESRLASLRIIGPPVGSAKATRLEVRVPGADMHPHYTLSAILALGLYGIENKLQIEIPPTSIPDWKPDPNHRLAKNLHEATEKMMAKDSMARKVFGDAFVDHFGGTREHEWNQFQQHVTDWERRRYLELA